MAVVALDTARPKTLNRRYKNTGYVVSYQPEAKTWKWTVKYETVTYYSEEAKSIAAAIKASEKHIDLTLGMRGEG